jgi:CubicO group peptidase (beta-lactamase class C family)
MTKSALGFCSGKPKREPGSQFDYNNCDYIVLGATLESLSGKSYAALVRDRVIQPLDLKSWVIAPSEFRGRRCPAALRVRDTVAGG